MLDDKIICAGLCEYSETSKHTTTTTSAWMVLLYTAYEHANQHNFINILYSNIDLKTFTYNLNILYL